MAAVAPPIAKVRNQGFSGYNVAWSPFFEHRLAVAGAANVSSNRTDNLNGAKIDR